MSLNPAQREAVDLRDGPVLVLAGAGTGKTRVITHRVAALLDEAIPAWRILAVTFTNKAAAEMRHRIERLAGDRHDVRELWVGTFHSICARILRRYGEPLGLSKHFSIYDTSDQTVIMREILRDLGASDRMYTPRGVLGHIDRAKNRGLDPERMDELGLADPVRSVVRKAYAQYQVRLREANAVDFGDLILLTVELLRRAHAPAEGQLGDLDPVRGLLRRFMHVLVDEFQDTNPIQAELVDRLAERADLCVVGDDDQAIYGWRGADVRQILHFQDRHPGTRVIRLEQNYRSTMSILRCADAVIRKNHDRLGKTLWSENGDGEPVRVLLMATERDEARFIAQEIRSVIDEGEDAEQIAIFYRTHAQSRVLEDEVRQMGLSCRIVGGVAFYERQEVKDALSYLAVLGNPNSDAHLLRILNRPTRGIGQAAQARLLDKARVEGVSLWRALHDPAAAGLGRPAVRKVEAFVEMIEALREKQEGRPLDAVLVELLEATGYHAMLAADDDEESADRLGNLQELLGNVQEFVQANPDGELEQFLELVSLDGGERAEGDRSRAVTLMTVHSAKGLEFDRVYLTGMEERVFPHARVIDDPLQMEEERRLAYVALTRAKRTLTLTMTQRRHIYGQMQVGQPSRFVLDLPKSVIVTNERRPRPSMPATARKAPAPARPAWQDDIVDDAGADLSPDLEAGIDADAPAGEGMALYVGMKLRHPMFGTVEVLGWSGVGAKLKLRVRLANREIKTIMARSLETL